MLLGWKQDRTTRLGNILQQALRDAFCILFPDSLVFAGTEKLHTLFQASTVEVQLECLIFFCSKLHIMCFVNYFCIALRSIFSFLPSLKCCCCQTIKSQLALPPWYSPCQVKTKFAFIKIPLSHPWIGLYSMKGYHNMKRAHESYILTVHEKGNPVWQVSQFLSVPPNVLNFTHRVRMRSTVCAFNCLCVQRHLARQGEVCWNASFVAWNVHPFLPICRCMRSLSSFSGPSFPASRQHLITENKTTRINQYFLSITFVNIVVVMFAGPFKRMLCFSLNILFISAFPMEFSLVTNSKAKLQLWCDKGLLPLVLCKFNSDV